MYKFSDFDTVQELPNVVNMKELSEAVGLSLTRTYELVSEMKMPVFQTGKKKFMFKEHILQCFDGCPFYTPVAELKAIRGLPRVFNPKYLMISLKVSHGYAYQLASTPGFPVAIIRGRYVVNKQGLIKWLEEHAKNL